MKFSKDEAEPYPEMVECCRDEDWRRQDQGEAVGDGLEPRVQLNMGQLCAQAAARARSTWSDVSRT